MTRGRAQLYIGGYGGARRFAPLCRYMGERAKEDAERDAYRHYLGECVRLPQSSGECLSLSWLEVVDRGGQPKETRSGDEIAAAVIKSTGIEVV